MEKKWERKIQVWDKFMRKCSGICTERSERNAVSKRTGMTEGKGVRYVRCENT